MTTEQRSRIGKSMNIDFSILPLLSGHSNSIYPMDCGITISEFIALFHFEVLMKNHRQNFVFQWQNTYQDSRLKNEKGGGA